MRDARIRPDQLRRIMIKRRDGEQERKELDDVARKNSQCGPARGDEYAFGEIKHTSEDTSATCDQAHE